MFTKKLSKKINKILLSITLAVGLFISAGSGLVFNLAKNYGNASVYAASITEEVDKSSLISNNNFNSSSSATTPPSVRNWTEIDDKVTTPEDLVAGVFNSYEANQKTDEDYLDDYKLLASPGHATSETNLNSTDPIYKSFMINSPTQATKKGYESDEFTLEKDSYYMFRVVLRTANNEDNQNNPLNNDKNYANFDSRASIYLVDDKDEVLTSLENIDSSLSIIQIENGYAEYKLYVSTKTYSSTKANLQLYLGSKTSTYVGPVFFNSVNILKLSQNRYLRETAEITSSNKNVSVLNMNSSFVENIMQNPSFEKDWQQGWQIVSNPTTLTSGVDKVLGNTPEQSNGFISANLDASKDVPNTNNSSDSNNSVLLMYNNEADSIGVESDEITIKQHGHYKLDIWSWSNSNAGSATIKLIDKSDRELEEVSTSVSATVSKSETSLTNNWTKHSFYINGDAYKDVTVAVQLWLGTTDEKVKGYVYFDDITLQALSYENYNSSKNSNVLDYNPEDSFLIKNSTFNIAENSDDNSIAYPLSPTYWTAKVSQQYALSGVVNIGTDIFNGEDLKIDNNYAPSRPSALPGTDEASNNVLMIASAQASLSQSYTSTEVSLSDSYYVLSVSYYAVNGGVGIKLIDGDNYLYNLTNLQSNGWQTVQFAIKKGTESPSLKVELSLAGQTGYVYFDEVELLVSNETYFNSLTTSNYVKKIDLTNYNFENTFDNGNTLLPLNYFEVATTNSNVESGIVNLNKGYAGLTENNPNNKYALVVSSATDVYHYLETTNSFSVGENSYYVISVKVKTHDLNTNGDANKMGARIYISGEGLDKTIEGIKTNGSWETYTFYIASTASTSATLQLGLGSSENLCSGIALFDDITIEQLADQTAFDAAIDGKINDDYNLIINSTDTTEETETNEEDADEFDPANLWYILPSLISALALIVAIVVTFARKINWKRPSKKVKTSYDRKKTVEKDLDRREKIELRKQMISELELQLKDLNEEIERYVALLDEHDKAVKEKLAKEHKDLLDKKLKTTAEKENALRERNEKIAQNKQAFTVKEEEDFNAYIKKLEIKEAKEQKAVIEKEVALKKTKERKDAKLQKYLQKQEFIRKEIERIDKEIEEIAREEAQIWEEYKLAKQEARARKAEYKKQLKVEKEKSAEKSPAKRKTKASEENIQTTENSNADNSSESK